MRVLVLAITHRTLGNIAPVLRALERRGDVLGLIWCPTSQVLEQGPAELGFSIDLEAPAIAGTRTPPRSHEFWQRARAFVSSFAPDVIVSDDMTAQPVRFLRDLLDELPARPPLVAFQHGLHQNWQDMSAHFAADAFLCFGVRHVFGFPVKQWTKVVPVGLPKLDSLKGVETEKAGFAVYFAQPYPSPSIIVRMATELAQRNRVAVKIRPHPIAPHAFGPADTELGSNVTVAPTAEDPIDLLRRCDAFISTHSTAVLEAILLGKPTVVMPSHGLIDFAAFPYVARDFTALDCVRGLQAFERAPEAFRDFVDECCGGWRFNSTARAVNAILAVGQSQNGVGLPPGWWRGDCEPLAEIAASHPLHLAATVLSDPAS